MKEEIKEAASTMGSGTALLAFFISAVLYAFGAWALSINDYKTFWALQVLGTMGMMSSSNLLYKGSNGFKEGSTWKKK